MDELLRRGRLEGRAPPEVAEYASSLKSDREIFRADIMVDYAHVVMLMERNIIPVNDGRTILASLRDIEAEGFDPLVANKVYEDIHVAIESELVRRLSEDVAGRIHTARSRNDEVAACIRITLRDKMLEIGELLVSLLEVLLKRAQAEKSTIMPGYTHLQIAQPTTFAHHLLAHYDSLARDLDRINDAYSRINLSPLGAAALSTTGYPIDRKRTAELLGFDGLVENSMDAVSARDFALEALSTLSILMVDVSRLAEEMVIWSSVEFKMIELSDQFSSASSIMPQKKNPDTMELARAKCGRVLGDLVSALSILKSLPYAYNRDFQEVTPLVWDAAEQTKGTLRILAGALDTLTVDRGTMLKTVAGSYATATELADTLVREKGLPFRTAHMLVGALVKEAVDLQLKPNELKGSDLKRVSKAVIGKAIALSDEQIQKALDPATFIRRRDVVGGPGPRSVASMLSRRRRALSKVRRSIALKKRRLVDAERELRRIVGSVTRAD